jgi:hypothetical protein
LERIPKKRSVCAEGLQDLELQSLQPQRSFGVQNAHETRQKHFTLWYLKGDYWRRFSHNMRGQRTYEEAEVLDEDVYDAVQAYE